jgi:transcriptional regulator with XRE-family HTH domain
MIFATRLKELRTQNELTQAELAIFLDVHSITVSRWERAVLLPSAKVLLKISACFNVSCDYLLGIDK